jgi:hypothetical protein
MVDVQAPAPPTSCPWIVLSFLSLVTAGRSDRDGSPAPIANVLSRDPGCVDAHIGWVYPAYSGAVIATLMRGGLFTTRGLAGLVSPDAHGLETITIPSR